jgi:hypothetical protein
VRAVRLRESKSDLAVPFSFFYFLYLEKNNMGWQPGQVSGKPGGIIAPTPSTRCTERHHKNITKLSEQKEHQDTKKTSRCPSRSNSFHGEDIGYSSPPYTHVASTKHRRVVLVLDSFWRYICLNLGIYKYLKVYYICFLMI